MMKRIRPFLTTFLVASSIAVEAADLPKAATFQLLPPEGTVRIVQRELLTLPGYSVFDYLSCKQLDDGSLILTGQVIDPSLKRSAVDAALAVAGPTRVVDRIEVLPSSAQDQRLRSILYRQIYGDDGMTTYAIRAVAPIHIIVKNAQVTLEGVVDSAVDRMHAESAAQFADSVNVSVTNHLIALKDADPLVSPLHRSADLQR